MAPATGFEPVTFRLTAERSTAELRGIIATTEGIIPNERCLRNFGLLLIEAKLFVEELAL